MSRGGKIFIIFLFVFGFATSYVLSYLGFDYKRSIPNTPTITTDKLSGRGYNTGDSLNYIEANRYGSFYIGFDDLGRSGVSKSDLIYIEDVLMNFTMYNLSVFNGKISYVKDSYARTSFSSSDITSAYNFMFGVNDENIHKVVVHSNWLQNKIKIEIFDSKNSKVFEKSFNVYVS